MMFQKALLKLPRFLLISCKFKLSTKKERAISLLYVRMQKLWKSRLHLIIFFCFLTRYLYFFFSKIKVSLRGSYWCLNKRKSSAGWRRKKLRSSEALTKENNGINIPMKRTDIWLMIVTNYNCHSAYLY